MMAKREYGQYATPIETVPVGLPKHWIGIIRKFASLRGISMSQQLRELIATNEPFCNEQPGDYKLPIKKSRGTPPKTKRNQEIYWLYTDLGLTYQEIGNEYGISRERVRQILETMDVNKNDKGGTPIPVEEINHPQNDYLTRNELNKKYTLFGKGLDAIDHETRRARRNNIFRRFLRSVIIDDPEKCWLMKTGYNAYAHPAGYWHMRLNENGNTKYTYAHHVSFELFHGKPAQNYVLHSCDNSRCVNPHHLYDGTPQDNVDDRGKAGNSTGAKFNFQIAEQIRSDYNTGEYTYEELTKKYGCSLTTIYQIMNHITYPTVPRKRKYRRGDDNG